MSLVLRWLRLVVAAETLMLASNQDIVTGWVYPLT